MLNFAKIKEIKLTDVLARYKIALRYKTDYAVCVCPLPTHKKGDTSKSFSINLTGNYWRCFSDSCNANNGGKRGGDVINFVAVMENCREKDAAQKLAQWYGVAETKTPQHIVEASNAKPSPANYPDSTKSAVAVNYMASIDTWFDETFKPIEGEEDSNYWVRVRKSVKNQLVLSYKAGQKSR